MQTKKHGQEQENIGDGVNEFIQRNRKGIFALLAIIVLSLIGAVVFLSIKDNLDKKAAAELEDIAKKYDELIVLIDDDEMEEDIDALVLEIETFAGKTRGFSGSKAWEMAGQIHSKRKDWENAYTAFLNASKTGKRTSLGPITLFNAAVAAEELGNYEIALDLLQQCLAHKFEFPSAPRAQFAVGRLNEQLGNTSEATEAYRTLMIKWPELPMWSQLARNRIVAIDIAAMSIAAMSIATIDTDAIESSETGTETIEE